MSHIDVGEVIELLVSLIRNECVNDGHPESGHEHRSVDTLAGYLGGPGEVFEPHPGRQSVLYRVPGAQPGAPRLMLMGHLDVVPADPAGWSVAPFEGVRTDGFVWGRGTVDMLNQTASMAVVFRRFLTGELPPLPGDLLYLAAADEEAGGRWGAAFLTDRHWDRVAAEYLITEIGAPMLTGAAGPGLPVTVAEKGPHWRRLRAAGTPGHGSQPYGARNALTPVARAVATLADTPAPVVVTDVWREFVEAWDPGPDPAVRLLDPERIDDAIDAVAREDPGFARWIHACTHMTVSPNVLRAGANINVVPASAEAGIDIRMLPGQVAADLDAHLDAVLGEDLEKGLTIEEIESTEATATAPEGPLWQAVGDALRAVVGPVPLLPVMTPVATDARFFRRRGTRAYGFTVSDDRVGFADHLAMFHGHDERISEGTLRLTTDHLLATVQRFGELTRP